MLLPGDCLEVLKTLPDCSVDSLVTDPPAGISFMGKAWDDDKGGRDEWIAWLASVMRECHRVLKPGAHGLVWAIPRTSHWTGKALEDAGFEVRDCITHLFGSGFPKSLDISKAIDKAAGLERPRVPGGQGGMNMVLGARKPGEAISGEAISGEAIKWNGWGTALKPAAEFWWLVRKPLSEKTVAANVLKHGTGGINIDGCRIEGAPIVYKNGCGGGKNEDNRMMGGNRQNDSNFRSTPWENTKGRFPANLVLSHSPYCTDVQCDIECAVWRLDEQSGTLSSGSRKAVVCKGIGYQGGEGDGGPAIQSNSGGASRFFYCAKISSSERNAGLEEFPDREGGVKNSSGRGFSEADPNRPVITKNHHPTVKPKKLMGYLCRLITPPGGTVLDPFMGSGSTGIACREEGFGFVGIEREPEYFEIAKARIGEQYADPTAV